MIFRASLDRDGVTVRGNVVPSDAVSRLRSCFIGIQTDRAGARCFDLSSDIMDVIQGPLRALAREGMGGVARPARVLFFDKTPESNWAVPWHQDRTIAVKQRIDTDG